MVRPATTTAPLRLLLAAALLLLATVRASGRSIRQAGLAAGIRRQEATPRRRRSLLQTAPWQLLWADEFNTACAHLDAAKWDIMLGDGSAFGIPGWGNNELERYTARPANVRIEKGNLVLQAQAEPAGSPYGPFTSGRIRTEGRFSIAPSAAYPALKIEARIKMPKGAGLWPAFWLLPEEWRYGTWPLSGEINVIEAFNAMDWAVGSLHFGQVGSRTLQSNGTAVQMAGRYRTYTFEWEAAAMRWYVDGKLFHSAYSSRGGSQPGGWWTAAGPGDAGNAPFDRPFHILLNMAVGGDFTGADADAVRSTLASGPKQMLVDWVRVYGRPAPPSRSKG